MSIIKVVGIDLGKSSFHLVGHDHTGREQFRKKYTLGFLRTIQRGTHRGVGGKAPNEDSEYIGANQPRYGRGRNEHYYHDRSSEETFLVVLAAMVLVDFTDLK